MPDLERWQMPHRSVDMQDWTAAKNMATNLLRPDRTKLLDLYDSILVDSHLASTMESRVLRVVRSKFRLVKHGKPQPELMPLLETPWFEDFLQYAAEAPFRGHTLIELGELAKPGELRNVTRIDPRNVLPYTGVVVRRQGEETGYAFREPPLNAYLIEVGRPEDLGLLCDVAPVAIVKKYAVGSWSDYVHKYGIPPRWVKTHSRDARRFKQLEQMMQNMLSSAYGVIEGDEEIQIMQTPGTDAWRVFDQLITRMNSEMSKRLLGQDGTSDNKDASGTYGSLKVLQGVAEDRHQADKAAVRHLVNNELLPRLTALGYPFQGVRFEWDELRDMAPGELVDAVSKLGLVFDIDPKHVEERTGIKLLGPRRMPGEVGAGTDPSKPAEPPEGNPPGNGRQGGGQPAPTKEEHENEEDGEDDGVTASWPGAIVNTCGVCGGSRDIRAQAAPELASEVLEQLLRDVHAGAKWSQPYFEAVRDVFQEGLVQAWSNNAAQLSYDAPDHAARAAMEMNLARFSAAKGKALTLELALVANETARESSTFADFKRRVEEKGLLQEYNQRYLATEYSNAVMTGMQASRWYELQRSSDALPAGEYWTQGDDQVRPAHRDLNGKVWPLNHPIWNTIWPPNGWGCRCTVLPVAEMPDETTIRRNTTEALDTLEITGERTRMRKTGFDKNRAITGQVFDLNKAYRDVLGNNAGTTFKFGVKDSYGSAASSMTSQAIAQRGVPAIRSSTPTEADARAWFEHNKTTQDIVVLRDAAGRPIQLYREVMYRKLRKEPHRATLVDQMGDVLASPDEVWLDQKGDLVHIRFTAQGVIRVPVALDMQRGLWVRSFYVDAYDADTDNQRQGLLLKRHQ